MDKSLEKLGKLTVKEFFARYPNEATCLEHIFEVRFGLRHTCRACGVEGTFHKLNNRRAYSCSSCGDHVYPTAGTVFQDTRTPLQVWFYAIYLFVTTRHGVSGKELQRTLGVTYKTAWRMGQQIRQLMAKADAFQPMSGHVEADETFVGGVVRGRDMGLSNKTIVVGLKERGGRVHAEKVKDRRTSTLQEIVWEHVTPGARVSTDEMPSYNLLKRDGYIHESVNHHAKEYVRGDTHTNSIESFWRLFKQSIKSTHIHVSAKYMDRYLREFTFRSNHRQMTNAMFDLIIAAA